MARDVVWYSGIKLIRQNTSELTKEIYILHLQEELLSFTTNTIRS
jgi:hypothetical protein